MDARTAIRAAPAWFQWTVFPVTLTGVVGLALWLIAQGMPAATAIAPAQVLGMLTILGLERIYPLHRSWLHSNGDLRVDLLHTVGTALAVFVVGPLTLVFAVKGAGFLSSAVGSTLWPAQWPVLLQLALALVLGEFLQYWWHRLQHENDWLWRLHAVHHSAPRLYWLNAARFHPFDILVNHMASFVLLILLGCGEPVLALFSLVSGIHGSFQHANLQLRCGPLNWFFSMAELHRWHHSRVIAESNHNFGQNLIVWDIVFGTRWLPEDRKPPEGIGLGDPALSAFPQGYLGQLASPFTWERIRRASSAEQSHEPA